MDLVQRSSFLQKHHRIVFYSAWFILGLLQSGLTELQDDEAYYWVYSKFFDWGYVDHPPMTGLLIKMGYAIFPNELGVRLFPLLLNTFSLLIIEELTTRKNPFLFYAIALSLAVLQVSGFVAVPDIPLIFFTALFFWCYRKFIQDLSLINTLLLGLCIALLLYSKYHAVLIVLFTLLSNFTLFRRYQTYVAGLIAALLFLPHIWWQYEHDWVSFRYHLFESNVNPYKFSYTTDYIFGQILLAGPIAGLVLLPAAFAYKTHSRTDRALKFTLLGIYAFFLLSSFRGKVEGNWTSPALVPLMILSHQFIQQRSGWQKVLLRLLPVTLILVLVARIVMIADFVPIKAIRNRYHAWNDWPAELRANTQGLPIVFSSSYQRASKYWFYSGQMTYSQNWYVDGRNNYNFWPIEDSMLGRPVYFMDVYRIYRFPDSLKTPIGWIGYKHIPRFSSFAKVNIDARLKTARVQAGGPLMIDCKFEMPDQYKEYIRSAQSLNDTTRIGLFDERGWIKEITTDIRLQDMVTTQQMTLRVEPALTKGKYYLRFTIKSGEYNSTHNSRKIPFVVE
ncbi:MAG: glycosyltransferase family 39 protein [Chitinophagaceae bacterium]|nr:glycosyltransferase family 39 protein [Chitinophagaceae bacterium]